MQKFRVFFFVYRFVFVVFVVVVSFIVLANNMVFCVRCISATLLASRNERSIEDWPHDAFSNFTLLFFCPSTLSSSSSSSPSEDDDTSEDEEEPNPLASLAALLSYACHSLSSIALCTSSHKISPQKTQSLPFVLFFQPCDRVCISFASFKSLATSDLVLTRSLLMFP